MVYLGAASQNSGMNCGVYFKIEGVNPTTSHGYSGWQAAAAAVVLEY